VNSKSSVLSPKIQAGARRSVTEENVRAPQSAPDRAITGSVIGENQTIDAVIPPWQRDTGYCASSQVTPTRERQVLIQSLTARAQAGVILDQNHRALQGTSGWVALVRALTTLTMHEGVIRPVSPVSQDEFGSVIAQIQASQTVSQVSVMLRDLDGWGCDIVQILPVGPANPDCVLMMLPKSTYAVARILEDLGRALGLSGEEIAIGKLILQGKVETDIAAIMAHDSKATRAKIKTTLRKFRVRRASDLIAMFARLP
jgi:DNA-binding CsgD family transcriptional regulator